MYKVESIILCLRDKTLIKVVMERTSALTWMKLIVHDENFDTHNQFETKVVFT